MGLFCSSFYSFARNIAPSAKTRARAKDPALIPAPLHLSSSQKHCSESMPQMLDQSQPMSYSAPSLFCASTSALDMAPRDTVTLSPSNCREREKRKESHLLTWCKYHPVPRGDVQPETKGLTHFRARLRAPVTLGSGCIRWKCIAFYGSNVAVDFSWKM